jgi:hypothetical protein
MRNLITIFIGFILIININNLSAQCDIIECSPVTNFTIEYTMGGALLSWAPPASGNFNGYYNIYRSGNLIGTMQGTSFTDCSSSFDSTVSHTWCVTVVCENGGESPPVCVTKESYIDNYIDMAALSITGPSPVEATETYHYTVTVKNNGAETAYSYTVKVITEDNEVLNEVVVNDPLAFNKSTTIEISVTFTEAMIGELNIKGRVEIEGDENPENDETSIFTITVLEQIPEIEDPFELKIIQESCSMALFTWNYTTTRNLTRFTVYLDDEIWTTGITKFEYLFENMPPGIYTAGVQANFTTGVSNVIYCPDPFEISLGISSYGLDYNIYPNPATQNIIIERTNSTLASIELYNAMGMYITRYETSEAKFEINIATFSAGTYFIRVTEGNNSSVKSFVKQ